MDIFRKRPLCLVLCIMLGGFSLFIDAEVGVRTTLIVISLILFAVSFGRTSVDRPTLYTARAGFLALAASLLFSILFSTLFLPSGVVGEKRNIEGFIESIERPSNSYARVTLLSSSIDDEEIELKLVLYVDTTDANSIAPGDTVTLTADICDFEAKDDFDTAAYFRSKGYAARLDNYKKLEIKERYDGWYKEPISALRREISGHMKLATDEITGGFLSALIMSERDDLHPGMALSFKQLGISHLLALSGMHLVILCAGIRTLLRSIGTNKKLVLFISTVFCLIYMAITGFSPSVVRSAIMLTITHGLFIICGSHDSYTSLPLSVVIILIFEPYAVYDLSLWLSVFATLGVLVYGELEERWRRNAPEKKRSGILYTLLSLIMESLLATLMALGASFFLMLTHFNTASALAPLANLLLSLPINLLIFLGLILVLLYKIIPFGALLSLMVNGINAVVEMLASVEWATLRIDLLPVRILIILLTVLFFAFVMLKIKRKGIYIAVMGGVYVVILAVGIIITQAIRYTPVYEYATGDVYDEIVISEEGRITLIINGGQNDEAAYALISEVNEKKLTYIDDIVLTGYRTQTKRFVLKLLSGVRISRIHIPAPRSVDEMSCAKSLAEELMNYGAALRFYETGEAIGIGPFTYVLHNRSTFEYGKSNDCILSLESESARYIYLSNGATKKFPLHAQDISLSADYLIFGAYGGGISGSDPIGLSYADLKGIYHTKKLPLSDLTITHLENKGVPITKIDTSFNILNKKNQSLYVE
ncbi:MAG: ComEC/Rec2 family competence protein [Clostridia bacterium]|nr:ComEC/Rec2 family competence protein [Clostridia bacterium]